MWDAVHGIEHADHHPKPHRAAFETVFARDRLDPMRSAMFEDSARNLSVPHDLGLVTVHVGPERAPGAHIHHHAPDLTAFLRAIVATGT